MCIYTRALADILMPTISLFTDSRKGKAVVKAEQTGEINPDCVNASNPYHKCGEHCKRKGDR